MGKITSATTVYATAYLTELGRQYLFQDENHPRIIELEDGTRLDRLKIERFSVGDPDVNYKLPDLPSSGDIPDLSGENENSITGAKGRTLNNLISPGDSVLGNDDETLEYSQSEEEILIDLNKDLDKLPTVITQELITLINNEPTLESTYKVTPTNFGENKVKDNQLIINLQEPTTTRDGYRMRIFYPTIEEDHNIMTIQFEKSTIQTVPRKVFQKAVATFKPTSLGSFNSQNAGNGDSTSGAIGGTETA